VLKINLIPQKPSRRRTWLLLALSAWVLVYGGWWWLTPPQVEVYLRPLQTEEKETVISTLEHLQADTPALARGLEEIKEQIDDDAVPCLVQDSSRRTKRMVWETPEGVVFSSEFFDADNLAQENALLGFVSGNSTGGSSDASLAVVK
jgi:hypothetical protein